MEQNKKYKVAVVSNALPYSTCIDNRPSGLFVDVWKEIANIHNLSYDFFCISKPYNEVVDDVSSGIYDVAIADFSLTLSRLEKVNYSRLFYISKVYILRKSSTRFKEILKDKMLRLLVFTLVIIIIVYSIISYVYKKESLLVSVYDVFSSFFYGNKDFLTDVNSKHYIFINTLWICVRYIFLTLVIANILQIFISYKDYISKEEYKDIKKVHVLEKTSYVEYVRKLGKEPVLVKSRQELLEKVSNSRENVYIMDDINIISKMINIPLSHTKEPQVNDAVALILNKKLLELLQKVDFSIISLRENGTLLKLSKEHLSEVSIIGVLD